MATIERSGGEAAARGARAELLDRAPPFSMEAERALLGSLLIDPEQCDEVALLLREEDFYAPAHQKLYRCLQAMHGRGGKLDMLLLVDELTRGGDLEAVGGTAYLAEVALAVPTAAHATYYAEIVREKSTLRGLIAATTEVLKQCYEPTVEARELVNRAEERIFAVRDARDSGEAVSLMDMLQEAMARIDKKMQQQGVTGLETGYTDLDHMTGGFRGSELIILAARPSMGKTALAANIATNVALRGQQTALFVSLEMSRFELVDRILCSEARVNGHHLRNGMISQEDLSKLIAIGNKLSQAPFYIDDTPGRTLTEIAATARRLKRKRDLRMIVIDYLQLIEPDNPGDPRQEQVAKIARRLKVLARELDVPVLCLAQLNRQAEQGREGHRPKLSQLRESGAIEQDADVVMFVHREEYYAASAEEKQALAGQAEVILAKQRNGPTGDVKLTWLSQYMRFESRSMDWQGGADF